MGHINIPTVVVHRGYKPYVRYAVELTSKKNLIYVIGSKDLEFLKKINNNIKFIDIDKYAQKKEVQEYKKFFTNYSTYEQDFAWYCFERIFILEEFLKDFKFSKAFHIDSDNAVFVDVNQINFEKNIAFHVSQFQSNLNMNASVHSGLLNLNFCEQYKKLYQDIYLNKTKFELIEEKYKYHLKNNLKGGVIDMTLYYLLDKNKLIDIQNLMKPIYDNERKKNIFINNMNMSEGFDSLNNFEMKHRKIKIYKKNLVKDIVNEEFLKLASMHFQGTAKKNLNFFTKFKFN